MYKIYRNSLGKVDAVNRDDGVSVPYLDEEDALTIELRQWELKHGSLDLSDRPPTLPIELLKQSKIEELSTACQAEIFAGFQSSALSRPHTYSSQLEDQLNLVGVQILALMGGSVLYVCTDLVGEKTARLHTAAQIQQVYADGSMIKLELIGKFHALREQVEVASSAEEIAAITWI